MADAAQPPVPTESPGVPPLRARRRLLIREVLVLQAKLILEGVRDVLLGPLSLGAALLDLVTDAERPGRLVERVMRAGIRFDRWLDLFGGLPRLAAPEGEGASDPAARGADVWFDRVEAALAHEAETGQLTRAAVERVERLLERTRP